MSNLLVVGMFVVFSGCSDDVKPSIKVGSKMAFGRYPYTASSEIMPIAWEVIDVKDNKALLLADNGLDAVPYNIKFAEVTWETSSIREWLNFDFYHTAFNGSEQSRIVSTVLKNPDNSMFGTTGGNDTNDKVFLLSIDEAELYLSSYKHVHPTPYAIERGAHADGTGKWSSSCGWLRSPGYEQGNAALLDRFGGISLHGGFVNNDDCAVRPAIWVKL